METVKKQYPIGTTVKITLSDGHDDLVGKIGTIVCYYEGYYGIAFKNCIRPDWGLWNLRGNLAEKNGRYFSEDYFKPVSMDWDD